MNLLTAGVDVSVIALWLGHADTHSTGANLHADMAIKQAAIDRTRPPHAKPGTYQPDPTSWPGSHPCDYADPSTPKPAQERAIPRTVGIFRGSARTSPTSNSSPASSYTSRSCATSPMSSSLPPTTSPGTTSSASCTASDASRPPKQKPNTTINSTTGQPAGSQNRVCQEFGVTDCFLVLLSVAVRRPSKVISKALRCFLPPVGPSLASAAGRVEAHDARYTHFSAACSVVLWNQGCQVRRGRPWLTARSATGVAVSWRGVVPARGWNVGEAL